MLDQKESNGRIFWTLLKAIKGKIIVNTYWELAYAIKQTRRDRMANTVGHITFLQFFMHGPFAFCYNCQPSLGEIVFWSLLLFFSFSKLAILFKSTHM